MAESTCGRCHVASNSRTCRHRQPCSRDLQTRRRIGCERMRADGIGWGGMGMRRNVMGSGRMQRRGGDGGAGTDAHAAVDTNADGDAIRWGRIAGSIRIGWQDRMRTCHGDSDSGIYQDRMRTCHGDSVAPGTPSLVVSLRRTPASSPSPASGTQRSS